MIDEDSESDTFGYIIVDSSQYLGVTINAILKGTTAFGLSQYIDIQVTKEITCLQQTLTLADSEPQHIQAAEINADVDIVSTDAVSAQYVNSDSIRCIVTYSLVGEDSVIGSETAAPGEFSLDSSNRVVFNQL